jgi:hypothetical protein
METRAPFIVVGAFVLAAIGAVFGFVYWLHNTAGGGARTEHHVQFEGSVSGLLVGAAVLFNGIRVGLPDIFNKALIASRDANDICGLAGVERATYDFFKQPCAKCVEFTHTGPPLQG